MKTFVAALAAAGLLAATALTPAPAQARDGGAVAAGVIGGLAAGAIIGGAIASQPPRAAPPRRVYEVEPVYESEPVYIERRRAPHCYYTRGEPHWDGIGWVRPRVRVCD